MRAIFQKKDKKGQNIWKFGQKFENILKKGSLMCATIAFMKQLEYTLNSEPALSKEWVELWSSFFACGDEAIEVTHLFNHFRWIWSDMPKVMQYNKLDFLDKVRLQQKQAVAGGISKILAGD